MIIKGFDILIARGDSESIDVEFHGNIPDDGCTAIVSMGKTAAERDLLWTKSYPIQNGKFTLTLDKENTDYNFNTYKWNIRVLDLDGHLHTPWEEPAKFRIAEVVGDEELG